MDLQLKGKTAVITGGTVGIGLAAAEGLAREGVHVVICARSRAEVHNQAKRISVAHDVKAIGVEADVTDPEAIARIAAAVKTEFGGLDILFNNAGTGSNETIMDAPDEKWEYYWNLHVMAAVRLSRALVPLMEARGGGVILNNASICASQPLGYEPIYNVTKAALVMLSKNMANEFIDKKIRVNTINPGLILTPDWRKTATQLTEGTDSNADQYLDQVVKDLAVPIGRFASPEELAHFIVFLCSPRASYSVGSSYYVDGGMLKTIT